jgi:hypothetical protein
MNFNRILTKLANADLTEEQEAQLEQLLTSKAKPDEQGQKADNPNPNEAEKVDDKGEVKSQEVKSTDTDKKVEENKTEELEHENDKHEDVVNTQHADQTQEKAVEETGQVVDEETVGAEVGRSINDYVLKEEVNKQFEAYESKFKAQEDRITKLTEMLESKEKENADMKDKYEATSFGDYASKFESKDTPTTQNVDTFASYWDEKK